MQGETLSCLSWRRNEQTEIDFCPGFRYTMKARIIMGSNLWLSCIVMLV